MKKMAGGGGGGFNGKEKGGWGRHFTTIGGGGRSCAQFYARVPLIEVKRGDGKEGMVSSRKCMCVCVMV